MLSIPIVGKSTLSPGLLRPKLAADDDSDSSRLELSEHIRLSGFRHFGRFSTATELSRMSLTWMDILLVPVRARARHLSTGYAQKLAAGHPLYAHHEKTPNDDELLDILHLVGRCALTRLAQHDEDPCSFLGSYELREGNGRA